MAEVAATSLWGLRHIFFVGLGCARFWGFTQTPNEDELCQVGR